MEGLLLIFLAIAIAVLKTLSLGLMYTKAVLLTQRQSKIGSMEKETLCWYLFKRLLFIFFLILCTRHVVILSDGSYEKFYKNWDLLVFV